VTLPRSQPWRTGKSGLRVLARVTPRSAREGVDGMAESADGPALKVCVRAVPDKGEANRAVEAVVAEWLGVAKGCVSVAAGGKSRIKTLDIAGDPAALEMRLRARLEQCKR
jgi:uncharacterized protein YggU (UPF0235/DUF167 family)